MKCALARSQIISVPSALVLSLACFVQGATAASDGVPPSEPLRAITVPRPVRVSVPGEVADPSTLNWPAMPLDIVVDVSAVERGHPGVRVWCEITAGLCRKWYPVICATLGETNPPHRVALVVVHSLDPGVGAHAEGERITVSVESILRNPADYGSIIHELAHIAQGYTYGLFRNRGIGWLVEGIADYVRFYFYEADPKFGGIKPGKSRYTDAYRSTACFLDYIVRTYDAAFVKKLHRTLSAGDMNRATFSRMLAEDADVLPARRKSVDALYADFLAEWTQRHGEAEKSP